MIDMFKVTNETDFDALYKVSIYEEKKPAILFFSAKWSNTSKTLGETLQKLSEEFPNIDIFKLDMERNLALFSKFAPRGVPTLILFKNGEVKENISIELSEDDLRQKMKDLQ
jgi:thioredoxin 1